MPVECSISQVPIYVNSLVGHLHRCIGMASGRSISIKAFGERIHESGSSQPPELRKLLDHKRACDVPILLIIKPLGTAFSELLKHKRCYDEMLQHFRNLLIRIDFFKDFIITAMVAAH